MNGFPIANGRARLVLRKVLTYIERQSIGGAAFEQVAAITDVQFWIDQEPITQGRMNADKWAAVHAALTELVSQSARSPAAEIEAELRDRCAVSVSDRQINYLAVIMSALNITVEKLAFGEPSSKKWRSQTLSKYIEAYQPAFHEKQERERRQRADDLEERTRQRHLKQAVESGAKTWRVWNFSIPGAAKSGICEAIKDFCADHPAAKYVQQPEGEWRGLTHYLTVTSEAEATAFQKRLEGRERLRLQQGWYSPISKKTTPNPPEGHVIEHHA